MKKKKSIKDFKIGDKVKTEQDHYEVYEGTVIGIERFPNPYTNSNKDLTWLRISYPFRNGSFLTRETSIFK
jgi:hypothetical protein